MEFENYAKKGFNFREISPLEWLNTTYIKIYPLDLIQAESKT